MLELAPIVRAWKNCRRCRCRCSCFRAAGSAVVPSVVQQGPPSSPLVQLAGAAADRARCPALARRACRADGKRGRLRSLPAGAAAVRLDGLPRLPADDRRRARCPWGLPGPFDCAGLLIVCVGISSNE